MSETKRVTMLDVKPLVIEVEEVIKKGLNNILVNFMERYELLENTHKQIMRLPSIRQELNKNPYESESEYEINYSANYKSNVCNMSTVESLDYRLDKLEKKYDTIVPVLDKILSKIISLDEEVKSLKLSERNNSLHLSSTINEQENIKINFEETIEEESECEDINPALATCSTIIIDKEPEKTVLNPVTNEIPLATVDLSEATVDLEEDDELSVGEELGEHEEPVVEEQIEADVEDESEEVEDADVEDNVEEVSEAKVDDHLEADVETESEEVEDETDDNLAGDVEVESEATVEAVVDGDVEDEVSIETETETKTEVEEEEEIEEEEEPVKEVAQEKQPSDEDDEELFEIEIDDKTYCTNDDQNGFIWELTNDGEQGEKIGYLKDGDAYFYEDEN